MSQKPIVAFGVVTRDSVGAARAQRVVDRWSADAPVLTQKGVSCVATARCMLGAAMATTMPSNVECVVLLDDDVTPSANALTTLIVSAISSARTGHPTVYAASYPLRLPKPEPGERVLDDRRLAHDLSKDNNVSGGLGCVAIPSALFRWLHLGDWTRHYQIMTAGPPSTCPYRVGPRNGIWMTEDLYFCSVLRELTIPSRLIPVVVQHRGKSAGPGWSWLDGRPLHVNLSFE